MDRVLAIQVYHITRYSKESIQYVSTNHVISVMTVVDSITTGGDPRGDAVES